MGAFLPGAGGSDKPNTRFVRQDRTLTSVPPRLCRPVDFATAPPVGREPLGP